MNNETGRQVGTLARGLSILEVVRTSDRPLTLADIAEACNLDASTTHRLLQILHANSYILRDEKTKKYVPSPKLLFPISIYNPFAEFRREAGAAANRIRDRTGQTAGFVLFCLGERILIEVSSGKSSLTLAYDTWLQSPIHASVSGKILILTKGAIGVKSFVNSTELKRYTSSTICNPDELISQLLLSFEKGFLLAKDEYLVGLTAIGVPIWSRSGACVGCLFLNGRSNEVGDTEINTLGELLKDEANLFSHSTPCIDPVSRILGSQATPDFSPETYGHQSRKS